jgi:hypothetical protein
MPTYNPQSEPGLFLETTSIFDVQSIYQLDINSEQFKEFLVNLKQTVNNISLAMNLKDTGYYPKTEFVNGQVYFPDPNLSSTTPQTPTWRQVFRKVFTLPGTLPNNNVVTVAHGLTITNTFTFTRIYGCSSNTVGFTYIPLPYTSTALGPIPNGIVEVWVDVNNINVRTNADFRAYNLTYLIIEYLKN